MTDSLDKIAQIRPWGTIIIHQSIICDGPNVSGLEDKKKITCYTHIHKDHITGLENALGSTKTFATKDTKELASSLYSDDGIGWMKTRDNFSGLKFGKEKPVRGFDLSFVKCNHILGSGQLVVRKKEESVCYSSDFMYEKNILGKPKGTHVPKDIKYLILDATHAEHSESQKFDSKPKSQKLIVEKAKEIMEGREKRLNIHASRGTLQIAMSWLREAVDPDIPFFASKYDMNIAGTYTALGHNCGRIIRNTDENFIPVYRERGEPYIRFFATKNNSQCELVEPPVASIKIGSTTSSSLESESGMYLVNLQEHATVDQVLEYVKDVSPEHVIVDNSARINNKDNATYLQKRLNEKGFSTTVSPKIHPKYMEN